MKNPVKNLKRKTDLYRKANKTKQIKKFNSKIFHKKILKSSKKLIQYSKILNQRIINKI